MQIKARKRSKFTPNSLATKKNKNKNKTKTQTIMNVGKDVKKLEASCPTVGDVKWCKLKERITIQSSNSTHRYIYLKELKLRLE